MSCFMNLEAVSACTAVIQGSAQYHARFKVEKFRDRIFFAVQQMQACACLNTRGFDGLDLNKISYRLQNFLEGSARAVAPRPTCHSVSTEEEFAAWTS